MKKTELKNKLDQIYMLYQDRIDGLITCEQENDKRNALYAEILELAENDDEA